jgi:hypothetical protein
MLGRHNALGDRGILGFAENMSNPLLFLASETK